MKILAETTGSFMLVDGQNNTNILPAHRPGVVKNSQFFQNQISRGAVQILAKLVPEATDEEFDGYVRAADGDVELAVASYLSSFSMEATVTSKPAAPATAKKKKAV